MNYSYDLDLTGLPPTSPPTSFPLDRLSMVTFANQDPNLPTSFAYLYTYNQAGRVHTQRLRYNPAHPDANPAPVDLDATYKWDNEGKMTSLTYPPYGIGGGAPPTYGYTYDLMGRLTDMYEPMCNPSGFNAPNRPARPALPSTPVSGGNPCVNYDPYNPNPDPSRRVGTATYGPAGEMTGATWSDYNLANTYSETRTYNSLLQLTRITTDGPTPPGAVHVMDMQYTFSATQNNGRITQSTDVVSGETVQYAYDALNRLASATAAGWSTTYTYDGFGNLTQKAGTGSAASLSFGPITFNAQNQPPGAQYDANGNAPGPGYDVENRLIHPQTVGAPWYTYDPQGKRLYMETPNYNSAPYNSPTACEIYFYGISGQRLVTYSCAYNDGDGGDNTLYYYTKSRNLYFGGRLIRSADVAVVTDRPGSVRANANPGVPGGERFSYYPYGEERTPTADGREKFGTYFRDVGNGSTTDGYPGAVDYADQRYYAVGSGRFMTPDPMGLDGVSQSNPGSWNRYAYVLGDPVNFFDRSGRFSESGCGGEGGPVLCALDDGTGHAVGFANDPTLGGGGGCILDGVTTDCSIVAALRLSGGVLAIPPGVDRSTPGLGQALSAMEASSCAGLFGTGLNSPASLLGLVQFVYQPDPAHPNDIAQEFDPGEQGNPVPGQFVIVLNTASPGYNSGTNAANTIIHELVHVAFSLGYNVNPQWTQFDGGNDAAEQTNNNLIVNNCGVGTIWP